MACGVAQFDSGLDLGLASKSWKGIGDQGKGEHDVGNVKLGSSCRKVVIVAELTKLRTDCPGGKGRKHLKYGQGGLLYSNVDFDSFLPGSLYLTGTKCGGGNAVGTPTLRRLL